jgi:AmiR/NasT family two-component response regulator
VTAITAVIYVPKAELALYLAACLACCTAEGFQVVGTVTDSMAAARAAARKLGADVIVIARRDHDPDVLPRVVVAAEASDRAPDVYRPGSVRRRRPRRV